VPVNIEKDMLKLKILRYLTSSLSRNRDFNLVDRIDKSTLVKEDFGADFKWGVATAAYQIEGGWDKDGKGKSVWDRLTENSNHVKDRTNGREATDFYKKYPEDLELLKELNFQNFRFSFSWTRILPDGSGQINQQGIDYYHRMLDKCLELGIEPWAVLYHWDLPQALQDRGGWANREIVDWFSEFAEVCTKNFGDRIKHWMVLNEPATFTTLGYLSGNHAPRKHNVSKFLAAVHHACLCQAQGGRIIRKNVPDAHIGTTFSCAFVEPKRNTPRHLRAAARLDVMLNRLFVEPSLGMGYPTKELSFLRKIDQFILPGDDEKLKFEFDFIGIQNYFKVVSRPGLVPLIWANRAKPKPGAEITDMGWDVSPKGIYSILKQFSNYNLKEILIAENGVAFPDQLINGQVNDEHRIQFFKRYLKQVLRAKNEGVPVTGYFVWTFVDNFEWDEGFRPRFGIVYNEVKTQQRTVKDSGRWFQEFLK